LTKAIADLVVMASRQPGSMAFILSADFGYISTHDKVSGFIVR